MLAHKSELTILLCALNSMTRIFQGSSKNLMLNIHISGKLWGSMALAKGMDIASSVIFAIYVFLCRALSGDIKQTHFVRDRIYLGLGFKRYSTITLFLTILFVNLLFTLGCTPKAKSCKSVCFLLVSLLNISRVCALIISLCVSEFCESYILIYHRCQ